VESEVRRRSRRGAEGAAQQRFGGSAPGGFSGPPGDGSHAFIQSLRSCDSGRSSDHLGIIAATAPSVIAGPGPMVWAWFRAVAEELLRCRGSMVSTCKDSRRNRGRSASITEPPPARCQGAGCSPKAARVWPIPAHFWSEIDQKWPRKMPFSARMSDIGAARHRRELPDRIWARIGPDQAQIWPSVFVKRPGLFRGARCGPVTARIWPKNGRKDAASGPLAHIRPIIGQKWANFASRTCGGRESVDVRGHW
jgi:hypothetical protein